MIFMCLDSLIFEHCVWPYCVTVLQYVVHWSDILVWVEHMFFKVTAFSFFVLLPDSIAYTPSGEILCYPRHLKWIGKAWFPCSRNEGSSLKNGTHACMDMFLRCWMWNTVEDTQKLHKCICCSCLLLGWQLSSYDEDKEHFEEMLGGGGSSELVGSCAWLPLAWLIAVLNDRSLYRTLMFGKETGFSKSYSWIVSILLFSFLSPKRCL